MPDSKDTPHVWDRGIPEKTWNPFRNWYNRSNVWTDGLFLAQSELSGLSRMHPGEVLQPELPRSEFEERYPAETLRWKRDSEFQDNCHGKTVGMSALAGLGMGFVGWFLIRQAGNEVTRATRIAGGVASGSLAFVWMIRYKGQQCITETLKDPDSRMAQLARKKVFEKYPQHRALEDFREHHPKQAALEELFPPGHSEYARLEARRQEFGSSAVDGLKPFDRKAE